MNFKKQFVEEFGIHFSKSELQFVLAFIEDLLEQQKEEILEMIKFDVKNDFPAFPDKDLAKKIAEDPVKYALIMIRAKIENK